jgi:hypothetical protein
MGKLVLFCTAILISVILFALVHKNSAGAECRAPSTLTATDYGRLIETTDDFIETNYNQENVGWEIDGSPKITPPEVDVRLYVGPLKQLWFPGVINPKNYKTYDLVLTRKCAGDKWEVSSFKKA